VNKFSICIVGSGNMAKRHCSAIKDSNYAFLKTAVVSPGSKNGEEFKNEFGLASVYNNLALALEKESIDIVIITSPINFHTEQVITSLAHGKDVLCEKPLAYLKKDFDNIKESLNKSGRILQTGMNCRFREQYSIPEKMVNSGEIGRIKYIRATYNFNLIEAVNNPEKKWWNDFPKDIYNYLHSGAIHAIDIVRWIGGEINEIFASGNAFELKKVWVKDTFIINIQFSSGAIGELTCSASAIGPPDFSLEIRGTKGSIIGRDIYRLNNNEIEKSTFEVIQNKIDLLLQFENLAEAIEKKSEPMNSFSEAQKNLAFIIAVEKSIKENRPIKIYN
jgi:predicted dehydrogenase